MHPTKLTREKQRGITLIEVLVGLIILSTAVLGAISLQARALGDVRESYTKGQASTIALDLAERFRGNPGKDARDVYLGDWTTAATEGSLGTCVNTTSLCTNPATMAADDVNEIKYIANQMLPEGKVWMGLYEGDNPKKTICVRVSWGGQAAQSCVVDGVQTDCVQISLYNPEINESANNVPVNNDA